MEAVLLLRLTAVGDGLRFQLTAGLSVLRVVVQQQPPVGPTPTFHKVSITGGPSSLHSRFDWRKKTGLDTLKSFEEKERKNI